MASRVRRRERKAWVLPLVLLFILIGLCYAVFRVYFSAPEQKSQEDDPIMIQKVHAPSADQDLTDDNILST